MRYLVAALAAGLVTAGTAMAQDAPNLTGRWGVGAYFVDSDYDRTLAEARVGCGGSAYPITPSGDGVMIHAPGDTEPSLHRLTRQGGQWLLVPATPSNTRFRMDRVVEVRDGGVIVMSYPDRDLAGRFGNMVYFPCRR